MTVKKRTTVVQLDPLHIHRRNAAEHATHKFKNHFVVGLASVDNNFRIYLCCTIVNQAEITIDLIQTPRTNPRLSAYAQIFGTFNFNATPMAPPGKEIKAHKKPNQHATIDVPDYL